MVDYRGDGLVHDTRGGSHHLNVDSGLIWGWGPIGQASAPGACCTRHAIMCLALVGLMRTKDPA